MSARTDTPHTLAAIVMVYGEWIEVTQGGASVRVFEYDIRLLTSRVERSPGGRTFYYGVTFDESQVAAVRAMGQRDLGWVL